MGHPRSRDLFWAEAARLAASTETCEPGALIPDEPTLEVEFDLSTWVWRLKHENPADRR